MGHKWFNSRTIAILSSLFPSISQRRLYCILEIHDVCPQYVDNVFKILDALPRDVCPVIGLVPRFLNKDENDWMINYHLFEELINKLEKFERFEIVYHGVYHDLFEFSKINSKEALIRLEEGWKVFKELGIKTDVFIPPNWAISKENVGLIREFFNKMSTISFIHNLKEKSFLYAPLVIIGFGDVLNVFDLFISKVNSIFSYVMVNIVESGIIRVVLHPQHVFLEDMRRVLDFLKKHTLSFLLYEDL